MNTLIDILNYGQSYWLDNLTRGKITSGELKKRVTEQGLRGITSNPSIFNKAISGGQDYEEQITNLVKEGKSPQQIYNNLTVKDVIDACGILQPVYEQSSGLDGFVSLEVSPYLARDTQGTIKEARELHQAVGCHNCLIKIPGTPEGIPAIEQMIYEGININVTLIFSVERYKEVAYAYIRGIERRVKENKPVKDIVSVSSIFISRIDTLVDKILGQHITGNINVSEYTPELILGKTGIATARLVYQQFKEIFGSSSWENLKSKGANVQRPLWASTSNKNPLHSDLYYVEPLIGKYTINTMPDETITAFAKNGVLKQDTIEEGIDEAQQVFSHLQTLGIDINQITQQLEDEGIEKFTDSYNELIGNIAEKRLSVLKNEVASQKISYGKLESKIKETYAYLNEVQIPRLLFNKAPYLWKTSPEAIKEISNCLGWLDLPDIFTKTAERIKGFALNLKKEGYTDAVLLGMGGSSLCSEVARQTFSSTANYMQLHVLDNTSPAAILQLEQKINIDKTLFIVASKSGGTKETISFFRHFYTLVSKNNNTTAGKNFVAITDEDTPLVKLAEEYKFREIFINPPGIGGRYSVLSDFGLLPMALMGIDISALVANAVKMKDSCNAVPADANPGIMLGALLGVYQKQGRDKVTFILSPTISSFGYWVEQLLAESTGKEGKGLIPINGETVGAPGIYGDDRVFIHMFLSSDNNAEDEKKVKALEEAGNPVVRIGLPNKISLGGEYYRWEIAVAIAGMIIGINPFDQPNVEESKKNTLQLLDEASKTGTYNPPKPFWKNSKVTIYAGTRTENLVPDERESIGAFLHHFISAAKPHDYIALLPYFLLTSERESTLQTWRMQMRNDIKVATTLLEGPRYLHSTGQLHKGGPDTGLYILLAGSEKEEILIPNEKYGFSALHQAQALGDFYSLSRKKRRVILINLGDNIDTELTDLYTSFMDTREKHLLEEIQ